jgi:hypothetical protein
MARPYAARPMRHGGPPCRAECHWALTRPYQGLGVLCRATGPRTEEERRWSDLTEVEGKEVNPRRRIAPPLLCHLPAEEDEPEEGVGRPARRRGGGGRPAEGAGARCGAVPREPAHRPGGGATGDGLGECDLGFECSFYTRVVHEFLADQDLTCYHHASPLLVSCSCRHYGPNWRPKHWHYRRRVVSCQNCVFPDRASVGPSCSCQLPSIHTEYTRRYMHTLKITIQSPFFYLDRTQRSLYEMPWPSNL